MTPEEQRIKIAEVCGWKPYGYRYELNWHEGWINGAKVVDVLPDYIADLNAMHGAEMFCITIDDNRTFNFRCFLTKILGSDIEFLVHATAAQRAEAFLRTLNLWKD